MGVPIPASAASMVGQSCDTVGKTQLDSDQINIVACVCSTQANCDTAAVAPGINDLKWAVMSNGPLVCPSGQALTGIVNGQPQCTNAASYTMSCPSGQVLKGISNGSPVCGSY